MIRFLLIISVGVSLGCADTNSLGKLIGAANSSGSISQGSTGTHSSLDTTPNKIIMVTGYWPPTNEMVQSLSDNPQLNPSGWVGKNWENSGYDVYSFFPVFASASDSVGTGDFPVDFAATYNDFMKYTSLLHPYALVGFGQGYNAWTVEAQGLPYQFAGYFQSGQIPSVIGVQINYPIPDSLKSGVTYTSSLPINDIVSAVDAVGADGEVNQTGAGNFLCGFMTYLMEWYHSQHSDQGDPYYNAAAGFIHVSPTMPAQEATNATYATLKAIVTDLP